MYLLQYIWTEIEECPHLPGISRLYGAQHDRACEGFRLHASLRARAILKRRMRQFCTGAGLLLDRSQYRWVCPQLASVYSCGWNFFTGAKRQENYLPAETARFQHYFWIS